MKCGTRDADLSWLTSGLSMAFARSLLKASGTTTSARSRCCGEECGTGTTSGL